MLVHGMYVEEQLLCILEGPTGSGFMHANEKLYSPHHIPRSLYSPGGKYGFKNCPITQKGSLPTSFDKALRMVFE